MSGDAGIVQSDVASDRETRMRFMRIGSSP
ncbi:MAG: hypothetical protein FD152_743 [Xanthobacteraceae bacterium]|nr:MAG: hypothetical protein FD152_743 [Xanthobacteraceae bacterium]